MTPMMKQYHSIKEQHPDCILFFRMGDFYEMFGEDAVLASRLLEITLTTRDKGKESPIPMCGVPYHSMEPYLTRLIKAGYKVAVCKQVEDPREAKGIVQRRVVNVVSPGTFQGDGFLDSGENNYIASLYPYPQGLGMCVLDISTGEMMGTQLTGRDHRKMFVDEYNRLQPRELIIPQDADPQWEDFLRNETSALINYCQEWAFSEEMAHRTLLKHFGVASLDGLGGADFPAAVSAAGAMMSYLSENRLLNLEHIKRLSFYSRAESMFLDSATLRNLDILQNSTDGGRKGSLLGVLDETMTAMGARMLRKWLLQPCRQTGPIVQRHEVVAELKEAHLFRAKLRALLKKVHDMERLVGRVSLQTANPRDLLALKNSLAELPRLEESMRSLSSPLIREMCGDWDNLEELHALLDRAVAEEAPPNLRDGGVIKEGYSEKLDHYRELCREGKGWIARLETQEREHTGIGNLRVGYNKVFGYYIEVTKRNAASVPDTYIRKQTLTGSERYITPELKEYEEKVLEAEEEMTRLEADLFKELLHKVAGHAYEVQEASRRVAVIDVLCALAEVAGNYDYTRPTVRDDGVIKITGGRHPVLERLELGERFVPNDVHLDDETNRVLIITGPNMAGKSTYVRQIALIVLMAQMGGFVPAEEAEIGLVDRIFTRVGAHDQLIRGLSTFMVEMNETANIVNNATGKSLIILDEIGRGTSTYDGVSIAWAVAEYIADKSRIGAKTLFATHYNELTKLAENVPGVRNYQVLVKESGHQIKFLRRVVEGSADKSYGIQVARLAGLPEEILDRARELLTAFEYAEMKRGSKRTSVSSEDRADAQTQLRLFAGPGQKVAEELSEADLDNMTPIESVNLLYRLKEMLRGN
jgi:DNA mismatch repair protein MutS